MVGVWGLKYIIQLMPGIAMCHSAMGLLHCQLWCNGLGTLSSVVQWAEYGDWRSDAITFRFSTEAATAPARHVFLSCQLTTMTINCRGNICCSQGEIYSQKQTNKKTNIKQILNRGCYCSLPCLPLMSTHNQLWGKYLFLFDKYQKCKQINTK